MRAETRANSAVDEQPLQRAEQAPRPAREVRQLDQPMRRLESCTPPGQLLEGDRLPDVVDHPRRVAVDLVARPFEMLAPELHASRTRELRIARPDVQPRLVEQRVL